MMIRITSFRLTVAAEPFRPATGAGRPERRGYRSVTSAMR